MRHMTLKTVAGAFLAATLSTACGSAKSNPCVVWTADNLANLAKFTPQPGATGCTEHYEELFLQQYVATNSVVIYPGNFLAEVNPDTGDRINVDTAHDPIASGNWDLGGLVDGNQECSVPKMSVAEQNFASIGGPDIKYTFHDLKFLQQPYAQGTDWTASVDYSDGTCNGTFAIQAIAPEVFCTQDSDCAPLPDLAAGKALGSGIAPQYHTFCDLGAAAQAFSGDSATGVCFFAEAYPSLCAEGQLEGASGSSCQLGQAAATP